MVAVGIAATEAALASELKRLMPASGLIVESSSSLKDSQMSRE
jgi:hypothetical protein